MTILDTESFSVAQTSPAKRAEAADPFIQPFTVKKTARRGR